MDIKFLANHIDEISKSFSKLRIAVAGGLGPNNLDILIPLLEKFPGLSINAQGGMRPSRDCKQPIDWRFVEAYLERSAALFKEYEA